jgi:CubicO group peptidase (beta-lactamase class C family)
VPYAASGARLRPRDMAKIGRLMLDGGRWNGRQVVPGEWVSASTSAQARVDGDEACGTRYGYYWWLEPGCEVDPPAPRFVAIGNGGQRIWVVPSRKLVVVTTAGLYNDPKQGRGPAAILAAALAPTAPARP